MATAPEDRPTDEDVSPDSLEQRQRADGTFVEDEAYADVDRPLTADEIEQRQEVVDPDDYDDDDRTD